MLNVITRSAERGLPLRRSLVKEAIEIFISRMTPARRLVLKFNGGTPGTRYLRNLHRRHRDKIVFSKPLRQEAARFQACNSDVLTTHFARLEKIFKATTSTALGSGTVMKQVQRLDEMQMGSRLHVYM